MLVGSLPFITILWTAKFPLDIIIKIAIIKTMKAYFVCNHCGEVIDVKGLNQEVECPRCYREVNIENASEYGERPEVEFNEYNDKDVTDCANGDYNTWEENQIANEE
jgi:predicted RNA-binding Zn-ribbon protein involved in translation (DUF1610 family)